MKHISASIIVLAAATIIFGASHFTSATQTVVLFVGFGVCGVALWSWFVGLKEK